jgi:hypothetical protein
VYSFSNRSNRQFTARQSPQNQNPPGVTENTAKLCLLFGLMFDGYALWVVEHGQNLAR